MLSLSLSLSLYIYIYIYAIYIYILYICCIHAISYMRRETCLLKLGDEEQVVVPTGDCADLELLAVRHAYRYLQHASAYVSIRTLISSSWLYATHTGTLRSFATGLVSSIEV